MEEVKSVEQERKGVDATITELLERERQLMNLPQPTQAQALELASVRDRESKLRDEKIELLKKENMLLDIARLAAGAWSPPRTPIASEYPPRWLLMQARWGATQPPFLSRPLVTRVGLWAR